MCSTKSASPDGGMGSNPAKRYGKAALILGPTWQFIAETRAKMKGTPRTRAEQEKALRESRIGSGSTTYQIPTSSRPELDAYDPATGLRR